MMKSQLKNGLMRGLLNRLFPFVIITKTHYRHLNDNIDKLADAYIDKIKIIQTLEHNLACARKQSHKAVLSARAKSQPRYKGRFIPVKKKKG